FFFQSYSCHVKYPSNGTFRPFYVAGGFSRKKPKRWSTSRSNDPAPKGFAPKAPIGTGSQKKDERNDEDTITSVNPTPYTSDDTEVSDASQVNKIEEQREDLGGTKKKVGESSMTKKSVSLSCANLLEELASVREFIEEGKSSNDTVYNKSEFIEEGKSGFDTVSDKFGL
ncbi:hypothetical protein KSS87_007759, partial [Heliosperma pusillum]